MQRINLSEKLNQLEKQIDVIEDSNLKNAFMIKFSKNKKFIEDNFTCPLAKSIFNENDEVVVLPSGNSVLKAFAESLNGMDPFNRKPFQMADCPPNLGLKAFMEIYLLKLDALEEKLNNPAIKKKFEAENQRKLVREQLMGELIKLQSELRKNQQSYQGNTIEFAKKQAGYKSSISMLEKNIKKTSQDLNKVQEENAILENEIKNLSFQNENRKQKKKQLESNQVVSLAPDENLQEKIVPQLEAAIEHSTEPNFAYGRKMLWKLYETISLGATGGIFFRASVVGLEMAIAGMSNAHSNVEFFPAFFEIVPSCLMCSVMVGWGSMMGGSWGACLGSAFFVVGASIANANSGDILIDFGIPAIGAVLAVNRFGLFSSNENRFSDQFEPVLHQIVKHCKKTNN